jgi:hypothetical protein
MHISNVIQQIDGSQPGENFQLVFAKKSGELRQMTATKRNRDRKPGGPAKEGSQFKYSLREKYSLLLNEIPGQKPKSIMIYTILKFNGQTVNHATT